MAANGRNQFGEFLVRAGKSFGVHAVFITLLFALGWWATMGYDSASDQLKAEYESAPDPQMAIGMVLDTARIKLWSWFSSSMLVSWLASILFIGFVQTAEPRGEAEGAKRMPMWIVLMLITLATTAAAWWWQLSLADIGAMLMASGYGVSVAAGFVLVLIAYWAGTGMSVKSTMRPSVPLGYILPRLGN